MFMKRNISCSVLLISVYTQFFVVALRKHQVRLNHGRQRQYIGMQSYLHGDRGGDELHAGQEVHHQLRLPREQAGGAVPAA